MVRSLVALALVVLLAPAVTAAETGGAAAPADESPEALDRVGWTVLGLTFAAIALGAAGMWLVNHRFHPSGEAQRRKTRKD